MGCLEREGVCVKGGEACDAAGERRPVLQVRGERGELENRGLLGDVHG